MAKNDFVFFWNGLYSQWYLADMIIDGVRYNSCEQYMMAKKALMFNDLVVYNEIMKSASPKEQKALGRKVNGFDAEKWNRFCRKIVFDGNYAKFTQNHELRTKILSTGTKELVEASPYDKIWGIGLDESDSRAWNKQEWLGTNWLGEELVSVREQIKNETNGSQGWC